MEYFRRTNSFFAAAFVLLLAVGLMAPNWFSYLTTISLAKALVVIGLVILLRAGLVSFGQGLYYCLGGYSVGIAGHYLQWTDGFLVLLIAMVVSGIVAAILGLLLCRYREIFFAMLTMAFSMILYGILVKSVGLGSTDGFNIHSVSFFGWEPGTDKLGLIVYFLACLAALIVAVLMHRYFHSPVGFAGEAIRENEIRVEYLGVSPNRIIFSKYILAAVLAGAGGGLTALASGHVDPEMAYWTTSGEFVFVALLSGTAHVAAVFIAAFLFEIIRTYAFDLAPYNWQMILGATLLLIIFFLPKGLWSIFTIRRAGGGVK